MSKILENFLYSGGFGHTTRERASDFVGSNRFDQFIMDSEFGHGDYGDDASARVAQLIGQAPLSMKRLANLDAVNPRQMLPIDIQSIHAEDRIPNLNVYQLNLSRPQDFKASTRVNLVQDSFKNYVKNMEIFNPSSNVEWSEKTSSDVRGAQSRGKKQSEMYTPDGSAAGMISNRLDENGYRLMSVESTVAF